MKYSAVDAFVYSCLKQVEESIKDKVISVETKITKKFFSSQKAYERLSEEEKILYKDASKAGIKVIIGLEPNLSLKDKEYVLSIVSDRDVSIETKDGEWQVVFSISKNAKKLKHIRFMHCLRDIDENIGFSYSKEFLEKMGGIASSLEEYRDKGVLWRDLGEKKVEVFEEILDAYANEIKSICEKYEGAARKLISYCLGAKDSYRVIMDRNYKNTKVEAFNFNKTLGLSFNSIDSNTSMTHLNYPKRLVCIERKIKDDGSVSNTTLLLLFDQYWSVSLRLCCVGKRVAPTNLYWDVKLEGMPVDRLVWIESWKDSCLHSSSIFS